MSTSEAPGLAKLQRKNGVAWYWRASNVTRRLAVADYPGAKSVRLHYDTDEERAQRCRQLTAELLEWLSHQSDRGLLYDGTLGSLIDCYQKDEDSPFGNVKHNTKRTYIHTLTLLQNAFGKRRIDALNGRDFTRWYRLLKQPKAAGGPERIKRAHDAMKLLRIVIGYGKAMGHQGCGRARSILSDMRFTQPAPRRAALAYAQAEAIVGKALAEGFPSMALAQALQFELSLRQRDVIGEWVRDADEKSRDIVPGKNQGGLWYRGQRWSGGVTWGDISRDMVLRKHTTKTGTEGAWDLKRAPLVMAVLQHFQPLQGRLGPVVVDEKQGRPYTYRVFHDRWRALARAVGVPEDVWNMDSRAGGITEADAAGAAPKDMQRFATHADLKTTSRYVRDTLDATSRVADLRTARRKKGD